jgi:hypothetical protein
LKKKQKASNFTGKKPGIIEANLRSEKHSYLSLILSIPRLPSLMATTTPNKKIEMGTKSSIGMVHPPFESNLF